LALSYSIRCAAEKMENVPSVPVFFINDDNSVDVYFGPKAPAGWENNWVQTVPGKGWNVLLRLYGPLEPWFEKKWKPGEFELAK